MVNPKRKNRDRISNLPDPILCHILSSLPTRYSVASSILSTRWKNLFTQVPNLDFNEFMVPASAHAGKATINRFINFVYKVLLSYDVPDMHQFSLRCSGQCDAHVNSWISAAIRLNVRRLILSAYFFSQSVRLTRDICTSKTLVELKLVSDEGPLHLPLIDSMCLPNLKILHLTNVVIHVGESNRLCFSSCPLLEVLCFIGCYSFHDSIVDVSVASLKRLELWSTKRLDFVLNVPALEFLDYCNHGNTKITGNVFESLLEAKIGVEKIYRLENGFQKLLKMASNVPSLYLDGFLMEVLVDRGSLPVFRNLTHLELESFRTAGWKLLPDLLESSPNLEILILHCGWYDYDSVDVDMDHVLPKREFDCLSLHLKVFEIRSFSGKESEFKFVEYFLSNAKVLNKMIIRTDEPLESRYIITQKLLALPKYSRDCKILMLDKLD